MRSEDWKELKVMLAELIESQKKTDQQLAETDAQIAKTDAQIAETHSQLAKTDAQLAKTDAQLAKTDAKLAKVCAKVDTLSEMYGGASNNQGKVAEEFFYNSLKHRPELDGIRFDFIDKNITRTRNNIEEEYDIILVNGSIVFIIEVKYRLHRKDIDRYVDRKLPNFLKLFPEYSGYDIRLAFASFHIEDELKDYAKEKGFLLLQRRGKVFESLAA
jgi:hypothetical protein